MGTSKRASWGLRALLLAAALASLTACETTPDRVFTYAAHGVEIQAERLVAEVYGQPADPLPYSNADIYYALEGIKPRWPSLKPWLDDGTVGLTEDGDVAIRDAGLRSGDDLRQLRALVKAENRGRFFLYRGMAAATGHSAEGAAAKWMEYVEDVFAREWWKRAPKGWWYQDSRGHWTQK